MKKLLATVLAAALLLSTAACSGEGASSQAPADGSQPSPQSSSAAKPVEEVTVNFFSTFPDRKTGRGLLEQKYIDQFMAENPNIKVVGEHLVDDAYKPKIQTYIASNDVPDIMFAWSAKNFIDPLISGDFIVELNPEDYTNYEFMAGALEAFTYDGKLFGLPTQADYWVMYYNEKIFKDNSVEVPKTYEEMLKAGEALNANGITPCSLAGKDKWPLIVTWQSFIEQITGDPSVVDKALSGEKGFASTPEIKKAGEYFQELMDADFFQRSFLTSDYATSKNLFTQGQTAMFLMGSWEMSMGTDEQIEPEIRDNIRAMNVPQLPDTKGTNNDLCLNYGAGYVVGNNSDAKDASVALINMMMKPENYAKFCWEEGVMIPVEKYDQYFTGNENNVQKDLTGIFQNATSASGSWICDKLTSSFKTNSEELFHQYASGMIDLDTLLKSFDDEAAKAR